MVNEQRYFGKGTVLTPRDVANLLNVHINTVRKWHDQGLLNGYRIGPRGDRRFQLEELEKFIAE